MKPFRFDLLDAIVAGCVITALLARLIGEMSVPAAALTFGASAAYLLVRYVEVKWPA